MHLAHTHHHRFRSFLKLYKHIHPRNVTEFSYRMGDTDRAHIYLSFMLHGAPAGAVPAPAAPVAQLTSSISSLMSAGTSSPGRAASPAPTRSASQLDDFATPTLPPPAAEPAALAQSQARHHELAGILSAIQGDDMKVQDISDNEVAKSHARYMVGGRAEANDERLFQFSE